MTVLLFLGVLFPVFLIHKRLLNQNGKFSSRRGVTGAEAARFVLDATGLKQTTVDCQEGTPGGFRSGLNHLHLDRRLYEGKGLLEIAESAWLAVLKTKASQMMFWKINRMVVLAGWILILLGFLIPSAGILKTLGFAAFLYVFLTEILILPTRWETGKHALFLLRHSGNFDADELARLKAVIRGLKLKGLAQFFSAPLEFGDRHHRRGQAC
ncbi:MAG: zinc metallopeptidase [Candidatus Omnitrophica bacterium]|nr:zinc metallopeptidase [Candidatus Omnitrophota bacterium]